MPQIAKDELLGLSARFEVVVDAIDLGSWESCAGLKVDFGLYEWKEGGNNHHSYWLPDRLKYEKITLTRAMSATDSGRLMGWLSSCVDKDRGGTAKITLRDAKHGEVCSWTLKNVLPSGWEGPSLDAKADKFAIEKLVLAHEGFL
jgi:phage tail-like protein